MRIALVLPGLSIGGTERSVERLAYGLAAKKHDILVVSLKGDGPIGESLRAGGIAVECLHTPSGLFLGFLDWFQLVRRLKAVLQRWKPNVVHSFLTRANVLTRCAVGRSLPVTSSLRVMEKEKNFHLQAERFFSNPSSSFTVNAKAIKDFAIEFIGLKPQQITVIYNGIPEPRSVAETEKKTVRERMGGEACRLVLAAGRLHRQKGFDVLIKAFGSIPGLFPQARLVIFGDGPDAVGLKALAGSLNLSNYVFILPPVPDLAPWFATAELFVLSSRWEGLPNILLEALSYGCPSIATSVGGVPEIFPQGADSLVRPDDVASLQHALMDALQNPAEFKRRAEITGNNLSLFKIDSMVEAHEDLYRNLTMTQAR